MAARRAVVKHASVAGRSTEVSVFQLLVKFIQERECIRLKKEAGEPLPWTDDPVLGSYRFTNVNREHDRVTQWIAEHWRTPHAEDPDLWFAMTAARHVNLPSTLVGMGYPVPWEPEAFIYAIRARMMQRMPAYNVAYMIRAAKGAGWSDKAEYLAKAVLGPLWERREELRPRAGEWLEDFYSRLLGAYGIGTFIAAQVVADVKYVPPLVFASDWAMFVAPGPGSRRGLNWVLGREPSAPWKDADWKEAFKVLYVKELLPLMDDGELPWLDAQNVQNCLCEFSKYMKAYTGQGRPKQRYTPPGRLLEGL